MIQYIVGTTLTIFLVSLFQLFGMCLTKNNKSYAYSFVIGYIVYSFFVAVVGIPIQILNLPWNIFFYYMIILLLGIIGYIVFCLKREIIHLDKNVIFDYLKNNWFLYVGAFVCIVIGLTQVSNIWQNNMTDDGYYLNKIATLPYLENPFRTDYVTGLYSSKIDTYIFNTFELEASFYVYITGMYVSLYTRFFLAILNYFIMLTGINAFIIELKDKFLKFDEKYIQYIVVPVFVFFVFCASIIVDSDSLWTMWSAAYYGSALVRVGATFIVLTPIINLEKLDWKSIILTFMCCVVMVSKSTVSVATLFLMAIGYLISLTKRKNIILTIFLMVAVCALGYFFPNVENVNNGALTWLFNSLISPFILVSILILLFISLSEKNYIKVCIISLISILLIIVPEVNDIFEVICNYDFVADRTIYSLMMFIFITAGVSLIIYLFEKMISQRYLILTNALLTLLIPIIIFSSNFSGFTFIGALKTYSRNIYLMPNNTIALGEALEKQYQQTSEDIILLMPAGFTVNNYGHYPAAIIRSYSPHTISLVGGIRIKKEYTNADSIYNGFSLDDLNTYVQFLLDPNEETVNGIVEIKNRFPFNYLVILNASEIHDVYLENIGFRKVDVIKDDLQNYSYHLYTCDL